MYVYISPVGKVSLGKIFIIDLVWFWFEREFLNGIFHKIVQVKWTVYVEQGK